MQHVAAIYYISKKKGIMLFRKHSLFFKIHENKMNAKHKEIGTTNVEQNPHEMDM